MGFFSNAFRVHRAGKIAEANSQIEAIQKKDRISYSDQKQLNQLKSKVAKLEEKNKIASEKNSRAVQNVVNNKNLNIGSQNKTGVVDNTFKSQGVKNFPKERTNKQSKK